MTLEPRRGCSLAVRNIDWRMELAPKMRSPATMNNVLFLDLDDVLCLGDPYGAYDVIAPEPPHDLYERLLHAPAVDVLKAAIAEHKPFVVITSSWTRFISRERCEEVFRACGVGELADALHENWDAPQATGDTRYDAIRAWLRRHGPVDSFAVVDDERSGTGLGSSDWDASGRVVWCRLGVGLTPEHLPALGAAFSLRDEPRPRVP